MSVAADFIECTAHRRHKYRVPTKPRIHIAHERHTKVSISKNLGDVGGRCLDDRRLFGDLDILIYAIFDTSRGTRKTQDGSSAFEGGE